MDSDRGIPGVSILGCGLIGASWVALLLHHGFRVQARGPSPAARDGFSTRIAGQLAQMRRLSRATGDGAAHDAAVLRACAGLTPQDAIILGQFSLARAAATLAPKRPCPILTTPGCAVAALRKRLGHRTRKDHPWTIFATFPPPSVTRRTTCTRSRRSMTC